MSTFIANRLREMRSCEPEYTPDYILEYREYLLEKEAIFGLFQGAKNLFKGWQATRAAKEAAKNKGVLNTLKKWRTPDLRNPDGSILRNAAGEATSSGKPSLFKSTVQAMKGGTPTRTDQLFNRAVEKRLSEANKGKGMFDSGKLTKEQLFKQNPNMRSQIHKEIKPVANMSKMEFAKHNPGEAARWFGKQVGYKGLMYGFPAKDAYDAYKDPNRTVASSLAGSAGMMVGMGAVNKAGFLGQIGGAIAGQMGGEALGNKAAGALKGQRSVPPPQFIPPPTTHTYNQMPPQQY